MCEKQREFGTQYKYDCIEYLILDYQSMEGLSEDEIVSRFDEFKDQFDDFGGVGYGSSKDIYEIVIDEGRVCRECYEEYTGRSFYADFGIRPKKRKM